MLRATTAWDRASVTADQSALADAPLDLSEPWPGLTSDEVADARREFGPNALPHARTPSWLAALVKQLVHPMAILLWGAAVLSFATESRTLGTAILVVLAINSAFAFTQERQAEHAVEAISNALPPLARAVRDGVVVDLPAEELVPGDVILVGEGDQAPADARILTGSASVDASMLTGESVTVERVPVAQPAPGSLLNAPQVVLRGTSVVAGEVKAVVFATGAATQIGVVADLTASVRSEPSPLEVQVKRVAWVVSLIAVGMGLVFLPIGMAAGLSWKAAMIFGIGLLIANVPEGLLPTITLALAGGVRRLARHGAVVKRLSAVETLGSTSTICTDKTGTLTQNRMTVREVWVPDGGSSDAALHVMAWCHSLRVQGDDVVGDPTEAALIEHVRAYGGPLDLERQAERIEVRQRFDARLRRMSVTLGTGDGVEVLCKGALESLSGLCTTVAGAPDRAVSEEDRRSIADAAERMERLGYRVLALADKHAHTAGRTRGEDEAGLRLVGLVGLIDPPRPDAADAVARCHSAGIRVHVITGDSPVTAAAVAREVGIDAHTVVDGATLARMTDGELTDLVAAGEVVFARASPEDKLRIATRVRAVGEVFAMTGDGVNDAPALRYADIGIAMGRSGTEVAREAANMVLTDDDFATIVRAIESGRQVYANIRKFVVYVFAHAVPEVVPFLLFALSGGAIPLGINGMQILAVNLATETLPALALGREKAESGAMERPPRSKSEHIITRGLLLRSWGLFGLVSAVLTSSAFLMHLWLGGWSPGDGVGPGSDLHTTYLEATSITFLGIVLCQVGTAFAARTERASLRSIGVFSNRPLLWGIAFELAVAVAVIYAPPLQGPFGTSALSLQDIAPLLTFPFIVWGVDELVRSRRRKASRSSTPLPPDSILEPDPTSQGVS